jgi:membrane peptidoglycan carboxypeptidase
MAVTFALTASGCALPRVPHADLRFPPLPQTSMIFDANGSLITSLHAVEDRTVIPLREVPRVVQDAVVAIEDQRFWEHRGVDVKAVVRAAVEDARSGDIVQGGSTITEQLVKNTITGDERSLVRKVKDALLAHELEKRYTKAQILEHYLNTVYFGQGAYGIEAAATTYFSHPAGRLTLTEGALLAALIASPSRFDPVFHPDLALTRRNLVLDRMRELDLIDEADYRAAVSAKLGLDLSKEGRYAAPYFVDYVKHWFLSNPAFGDTPEARYDLLFRGGLRITTTIDLTLQRYAEDAVDSILSYKRDPYGAMTVIDPRTGAIRAMVGGRDYFGKGGFAKLNLATGGATGRQAGSAFKPFALVTALDEGISPLKVFPAPSHLDIRLPAGYSPPIWPVDNYDSEGGGSMTVEQATINSVNTVYAQLIMEAGPRNVVDTAHRMGITSFLHAYPSAVLGANEVNPLEMASAYGTLATLGERVPPIAVAKITDASGRVIFAADPHPQQVVNEGVAWTTNQILQKVVLQGTGTAANIGRPVAGKTGTAQNWTNAWFVGYVPQLVAAVWVGFPRGQIPMVAPRVRIPHVLGGTWPAQIWRLFMLKATRGMPVENWRQPAVGYVTVRVDVKHTCVPNQWTLPTNVATVQYFSGTQPRKVCTVPDGPQPVPLPAVTGMAQDDASALLQSYAYQVQTIAKETSQAQPGTVLAQDPAAGTVLLQGSTVTLTVAVAPPPPSPSPSASPSSLAVPDVVGMAKQDAILALSDAGFYVQVLTQWQCDPPEGCGAFPGAVWQQNPPAGAIDEEGSTVTLWVNPAS